MKILRIILVVAAASLFLAACSPVAGHRTVVAPDETAPAPELSTEVYFYPTRGQSSRQQDRDRYECYLWAVRKTGFDPSAPRLAPHQQVKVVPEPPSGHDTATGALSGAIVGAAIGAPHNTGEGAIVGAVAGAVLGAASDAARQDQADRLQERYNQRDEQRYAELERQARKYRRAIAACLEGRGYSVY